MSFFDILEAYGEAPAIITQDGSQFSYRDVAFSADEVGAHVRERSLVLVACRNSRESLVGYLAAMRAGAVPLLVGDNWDRQFLERLLEAYRPEFLWVPASMAGWMQLASMLHREGDYVLLRSSYQVDYEIHDELALLLSTSGSTGSPKLVQISYRNIDSNTASIAEYLAITAADRAITTLPMAYTFGLSILNSHLLQGCSIVLTDRTLMDPLFWKHLKEHAATTFSGVPYTYEMLKKLRFLNMDIPSLRVLTQAGGKLGHELTREFAVGCAEKGIQFVVMYGQAEASPRISYLPPDQAVSKAGSIGIAIPGGELWLEAEDGEVISEPDQVGELVYRGDNVCLGYALDREDLRVGDLNKGVLRTGDLAKRDADGCYYIVGRRKRFLKLFGNRVNLIELEDILRAAGHDCACAGVDDQLKIFVTSPDGHDDIRRFIAEKTKISAAGYGVEYIEQIPRNEAGKIIYRSLPGGGS